MEIRWKNDKWREMTIALGLNFPCFFDQLVGRIRKLSCNLLEFQTESWGFAEDMRNLAERPTDPSLESTKCQGLIGVFGCTEETLLSGWLLLNISLAILHHTCSKCCEAAYCLSKHGSCTDRSARKRWRMATCNHWESRRLFWRVSWRNQQHPCRVFSLLTKVLSLEYVYD